MRHVRVWMSVMVLLAVLASNSTAVFAQTGLPSGRDGLGRTGSALPAQLPATPDRRVPFSGAEPAAPAYEQVSPAAALQRAGQLPARQWAAPRGAQVPAAHRAGALAGDEWVNVVVHLDLPAVAAQVYASAGERAAHASAVAQAQAAASAGVVASGGQVIFQFKTLSSGIAARIPASAARNIGALPGVSHVSLVHDYEMDLSETVPFIGASALQNLGATGEGVKVAVLDSGIDFSHLAFGGPGTVAGWGAAYYGASPDCDPTVPSDPECAYAQPANPALFGPAAPRVKGGYDFLGEAWPEGSDTPMPDPNPIDVEGHGTHVADIIGGRSYAAGTNADGNYPAKGVGVAPDSELYAFKVCASFSSSCNGLSLLAAMDAAMDLDGDPETSDPVDVVNLSLGSPYGQPEDDLTAFVNLATELGVIVVASAGNSANKPFIVGSPSIADGAISVAQTAVPSSERYPLFYTTGAVTATIDNAVFQSWSTAPGTALLQGPLAYGNPDGSNRNGCAAYTASMAGKVVLADRGACNFTAKAMHASAAGAVLSLIGLIAPGDPFEGGDGGDRPIGVPSFMVDLATATLLKGGIEGGVVVGIDPTNAINLAYTMVGSSSRGPRNHDNRIKPDIGAPGASVSAIAGSGAGTGAFGGTSGAAPMVSGVAALLKELYGENLLPQQYKALLMNTGTITIWEGDPGTNLAPITRIGGGQVDAAAANQSPLIAWDSTSGAADPLAWTGSLSFGYVAVDDYQAYTRTLTILNRSNQPQTVSVESFFRYEEDFGSGVLVTPQSTSVNLAAGATVDLPVVLEIFPAGSLELGLGPLHPWVVNMGAFGANGDVLRFQEYDGYLQLTPQGGAPVHVAWHVLPKAVAGVDVAVTNLQERTGVMANSSPAVTATLDIFDLMAVDGNDYGYLVGDCTSIGLLPGCNQSPVDLHEVGVRSSTDVAPNDFLEFYLSIWDAPYRAGQYPTEFDIYIDSDADGADDYVLFNGDLTLNASDGRNIVFLIDLSVPLTDRVPMPMYFIDATFNTQSFVLPMDAASIGVTPGQPFRFSVFAFDAYFTGGLWDCAPKVNGVCTGAFQYTPGQSRFTMDFPSAQAAASQAASVGFVEIAPASSLGFVWNESAEGAAASPGQTGMLLANFSAPVGESDGAVRTIGTYLPLIDN
ncbi:MAG: S8 family serine peptidase [Caldilinea sp.]